MAKLKVTAKIFTDEGKPAAAHRLVVQVYSIKQARWNNLLQGKTNRAGQLTIQRANNADLNTSFAPTLRLVEGGNPVPRILAVGGAVQFVKNQNLLKVDFGQIERLDETAYKKATSGITVNETIAGVAKRSDISILAVNRMVTGNPTLATVVAQPRTGATRVPATPVANPSVTDNLGGRVLPADINVAFLVNKEVQTLKAREKQLNSLIIDRERVIVLNETKLTEAKSQITILKQSLEAAQENESSSRQTIETLTSNLSATAKIDSVFSKVGQKLETANNKMKQDAIPYRVTGIKLDLRGSIINDGESMIFNGVPGLEGTASGGNSSVQAEIQPIDTEDGDGLIVVPDITGLTESACRRVIASIGLRLKQVTETIKEGGSSAPGQAMRQHPEAGQELARGSDLLVVFAVAQASQ